MGSYDANEVQALALLNKSNLVNKFFTIPAGDSEYKFKISGIGKMAIKIEKFFYYSDIVKSISKGGSIGFEFLIGQLIVDPKNRIKFPKFEGTFDLKQRALANKTNLKSSFINVPIGSKTYEFKISGIGYKSIKIELFMGYGDIVKQINSNNNSCLEFILMELLLVNEINYEIFNEVSVSVEQDYNDGDESFEVDHDSIVKLSKIDFDETISKVNGWSKLVFDAIDDMWDDIFTFDDLLNQDRILSYQVKGESLDDDVLNNLDVLVNLGLVSKLNKKYYAKLW